ncbi:MAG: hypothetical protein FWH51_06570 [Dehalococcoidia bacterium]|nr:hypothetical protein [Dehalococcoidia bacterium]
MAKKIWTVAKLNLKNLNAIYIATTLTAAAFMSQYLLNAIMAARGEDLGEQIGLSAGWALWLLILLAAIFIATRNLPRIVNLGGKREDYFWGSLVTYAVLACAISLVGVIICYVIDRPMVEAGRYGDILSVPGVFGWDAHGPIVAFLQQTAFLFLCASFAHTLTMIQGKWYGWTANVALIAVISVFTPIAPLRQAEAWFFNLVLFHPNALLQIVACVVLALTIYLLSKPTLVRRDI